MKLPKEWVEKELGKICEIKKGNSITKKKITDGNYPVIAGGQQPAYYHNQFNREGKTITVSASGAYSGFVNYFEYPIFASDCTTIKPTNEKEISAKYVFYYLKAKQHVIYSLQRGAGQPHVYPNDLRKIKIPVPPLSTQRKIVSILERAEKLKEKRRDASELLKQLPQSIFLEMFDWKKYGRVKLSQGCIAKPEYGSGASAIPYSTDLPRYIRITDINEDGELNEAEVSPSKIQDKYYLEQGDLLFARSGATVGKAYLHKNNTEKSIFAGYLIRFKLNSKIFDPNFVFYFTKTPYYKNWVKSKMKTVAQPNINAKQYSDLELMSPPIQLQNKFSKLIKFIDVLKDQQKKSTEEIGALFDALMQKAFKGELVN